jgi:hypothetical protein
VVRSIGAARENEGQRCCDYELTHSRYLSCDQGCRSSLHNRGQRDAFIACAILMMVNVYSVCISAGTC